MPTTEVQQAARREMTEDGARRGGMANGRCSKGWGSRCAASRGRSCRCACGGANHGVGRSGGSGIVPGIHMKAPAQSERDARFRIEHFDPSRIVIRDLGPWDKHLTVTNDAENVIRRLSPAPEQRVYYYDSEGRLDELVHERGVFARFAPGRSVTCAHRGCGATVYDEDAAVEQGWGQCDRCQTWRCALHSTDAHQKHGADYPLCEDCR